MDAILFQLKRLDENQADAENRWRAAAYDIWQLQPNADNTFCSQEGHLLILDGSASPALAKAIDFASNRQLSYTITFFEKATTWNYDPPSTPPARV